MENTYTQCHGVGDAELWHIAGPQGLEVIGEADLSTAIHLRSLAIKLWQSDLRRGRWVCHWNVELHVELVLEQIVHVPALAEPLGALLVGLQAEPVAAGLLVVLHVLEDAKS